MEKMASKDIDSTDRQVDWNTRDQLHIELWKQFCRVTENKFSQIQDVTYVPSRSRISAGSGSQMKISHKIFDFGGLNKSEIPLQHYHCKNIGKKNRRKTSKKRMLKKWSHCQKCSLLHSPYVKFNIIGKRSYCSCREKGKQRVRNRDRNRETYRVRESEKERKRKRKTYTEWERETDAERHREIVKEMEAQKCSWYERKRKKEHTRIARSTAVFRVQFNATYHQLLTLCLRTPRQEQSWHWKPHQQGRIIQSIQYLIVR